MRLLCLGVLIFTCCAWTTSAVPVSFDSESSRVGNDLLSQSESDFGVRLRRAEDSAPAASGSSAAKSEEASSTSASSSSSTTSQTAQDRQVRSILLMKYLKTISYKKFREM
jgi:hypothetical protein